MEKTEEVFEIYDNLLLVHFGENQSGQPIPLMYADEIRDINNYISYANKNIDKHYSEKCWYKDLKSKSPVVGALMKNQKYLETIGVSIDQTIIMICTILNYGHCNRYVPIPDRLCVARSETSKAKLYNVMYFLSKILPTIFMIKREMGTTYIKINKQQLLEDKYIKIKSEKFKPKDEFYIRLLLEEKKSLFFNVLSDATFKKMLKEIALGISIIYSEIIDEYITPIEQLEAESQFGKRTDITYIEVPIHLISAITGISSKQIYYYLNSLAKGSSYLKRHNKVYVDGVYGKHYYNDFYKSCNLENYSNHMTEDGKRPVTPFSYILFNNEFEKTKVYKHIEKHREAYTDMIVRELRYNQLDKEMGIENTFFKDAFKLTEDETKEIYEEHGFKNKKQYKLFKEKTGLNTARKDGNAIITTLKSEKRFIDYNARKTDKMLKVKNLDNKSVYQICGYIRKALNYIGSTDCKKKDFNYYLKMIDEMKLKIKEYIQSLNINNKIDDKLNRYISHYGLEVLLT